MKTKIFIALNFLLFNFGIAQIQIPEDQITITQYPDFYNQTVQKLNNIIPNKTSYYGQPLSVFLQALNQNNLPVKEYDQGPYNNKMLKLSFVWNREIDSSRMSYNFVQPYVQIYFQQPFNYPQSTIIHNNGYFSYWNPEAENFYKNLPIEKIEFWYVNGLMDMDSPPK